MRERSTEIHTNVSASCNQKDEVANILGREGGSRRKNSPSLSYRIWSSSSAFFMDRLFSYLGEKKSPEASGTYIFLD